MKKTQTKNDEPVQDKKVSSHIPELNFRQSNSVYNPAFIIEYKGNDVATVFQDEFESNIEAEQFTKLLCSAPTLKAENEKLKADKAVLLEALITINNAFWTGGETESYKIRDLKNISSEAIKKINQ